MTGGKKKRPAIEVRNVTRSYVDGEVTTKVLRGVSVSINEGEFVAIMGPSGSGKSTLMHIMGFLDRLSTGQYLFKGKRVDKLSDRKLAFMRRKEVGFVFQFFNLLSRSTVLENVMLPMLYAGVPSEERKKRAMKVLTDVGLEHRLDYPANRISGGERQRVAIARALVNNPTVIFADEPTGNLDTKSGLEVLRIFQRLHKQGHTIVMVTHEMEAAQFAKRIISIRDGEIESDKKNGHRLLKSYSK